MNQKTAQNSNVKKENHYFNKSGWLRAAVLGGNDGILSTTSLVIGVAAASTTRGLVILAKLDSRHHNIAA